MFFGGLPPGFEDAFGGGGMPGGGPGGRGRRGPVNTTKLYETLGIEKVRCPAAALSLCTHKQRLAH